MKVMKTIVKRFPSLLGMALFSYNALRRSVKTKENESYWQKQSEIDSYSPADDVATALFIRSIMEGNHRTVFEIGAADGTRIISVKKFVPNIEAFGLDIQSNYRTPFDVDGVSFRYFDTRFFEGGFDKPIMLSRNTLTCFSPDEVRELFTTLSKNGIAVAYFEPSPNFNVTDHTVRSARQNLTVYYHPYDDILEGLGYTLHVDGTNTKNWCGVVYGLECYRYQYATI